MVALSPRFLALWALCSVSVVFSHVTPGRRDFGKPSQLFNRNLPTATFVAPRAAETRFVPALPPGKRAVEGVTVSLDDLDTGNGTTDQIGSILDSMTASGLISTDAPSNSADTTLGSTVDISQLLYSTIGGVGSALNLNQGVGPSDESNSGANTLSVTLESRQSDKSEKSDWSAASTTSQSTVSKREYLKKARFVKRQVDDYDDDDDYYGYVRRSAKAKRQDSNAASDVNHDIADGETTVGDAVDANSSRILRFTRRDTPGPVPESDLRTRIRGKRQDSNAAQDVTQDIAAGETTVDDAAVTNGNSVTSRIFSLGRRGGSLSKTKLYNTRSHGKRQDWDAVGADTGRALRVNRRASGGSVAARAYMVRRQDSDTVQPSEVVQDLDVVQDSVVAQDSDATPQDSAAAQDSEATQDLGVAQVSDVVQNLGVAQDLNSAQDSDASQSSTAAQVITQNIDDAGTTLVDTIGAQIGGLPSLSDGR